LVQRRGDWAGPQPAQAPHRCCTKCNSPPINGQCTNHRIMARCCAVLMCPLKGYSYSLACLLGMHCWHLRLSRGSTFSCSHNGGGLYWNCSWYWCCDVCDYHTHCHVMHVRLLLSYDWKHLSFVKFNWTWHFKVSSKSIYTISPPPKKSKPPYSWQYFRQILTHFQNSFTAGKRTKFPTKRI